MNDVKEKSETEHVDLVKKANQGIGAIKELKKNYGDITIIKTLGPDGDSGTVDELIEPDDMDITFEIKNE